MVRRLNEAEQRRHDRMELGMRVAAALYVENMAYYPYNPPERFVRRWPEAADIEEVVVSMLTLSWRWRRRIAEHRRRAA